MESVKIEIPSTKASWFFPVGKEINAEAPEYEATRDPSKDGLFNFKLPSLRWPTFYKEDKKPVNETLAESSEVDVSESLPGDDKSDKGD